MTWSRLPTAKPVKAMNGIRKKCVWIPTAKPNQMQARTPRVLFLDHGFFHLKSHLNPKVETQMSDVHEGRVWLCLFSLFGNTCFDSLRATLDWVIDCWFRAVPGPKFRARVQPWNETELKMEWRLACDLWSEDQHFSSGTATDIDKSWSPDSFLFLLFIYRINRWKDKMLSKVQKSNPSFFPSIYIIIIIAKVLSLSTRHTFLLILFHSLSLGGRSSAHVTGIQPKREKSKP